MGPLQPVNNQTREELNQLRAEIDYLESKNAEKAYAWRPAEFESGITRPAIS